MSKCPFNSSSDTDSAFTVDINLSVVMNTVLDGLIITDSKGIIHAFNPAAIKIFGYKSIEVMGHNVKILMPEPYSTEHDGYLHNYLSTKKAKIIGIGREVSGKRKNGDIFPMELGVNEMHLNGKLFFVGTVRDISDRKTAENAILEKHITALERTNQALDDFAYIASHDLKEPLRGLGNNAIFLKEDYKDSLDEGAIKRIDRIIFLAERMEKLVNDLLHFARLSKQELDENEVDLNIVINDIISMMETNLVEANVKILIPKKLPRVKYNVVNITEVFRNLIVNAIKYNSCEEKIVEIGFEKKVGKYILYVKDNGIGIDPKYHNEIFRIFKRLNNENQDVKGTGVGLTFVKKIIERYGGNIWLESELGKGTTFFMTINRDVI